MARPVVQQYTYFSGTINNPDDNDMLIVRNPNDKYIRQVIWTSEVGHEGTPHIQMYVRLFRNQTMKFISKLYPRGHFKGIAKDEYNENTQKYAQKDDDTTAGKHVITMNETLGETERILLDVFIAIRHKQCTDDFPRQLSALIRSEEDELVMKKLHLSKMFVSSVWAKMIDRYKSLYWRMACDAVRTHLTQLRMENDEADPEEGDMLTQYESDGSNHSG